ncbi:MAG: sugar phosphate nucleotidyltransferase [Clostridiales bacterium]|nr:sugar phosphate nucleotidyltransferase [Clostridiales bacterium]
MAKPVLVVMAAGMGSRYGGLKQIDPITEQGEIIIDFSLYDAMMAGFEDIVFIIKKEIEADVRARIDSGAGQHLNITYVFQELTDLPAGYAVPEGRVKPWGTCHAILAAKPALSGNFAVINADDYYGPQAFQAMYEQLLNSEDGMLYDYSMVGYRLANTLTEHGHVARGVCVINEDGKLVGVDERLKIMWKDGVIQYEDEGGAWREVPADSTVSMNFWGFTPSFLEELEAGFKPFLDDAIKNNPEKGEYLLPRKIDELLKAGKASVKVLPTDERWIGVTYKEDKEHVIAAVRAMKDSGLYPEALW